MARTGVALLRASDRVDLPWRNGGGTTTVVASSGAGAGSDLEPDWRVSIATISEAGSFSVFPGVDRVLMPLSPMGLTLVVDGRVRLVARHETISFAGEATVGAVDVTSEGDDLNLMTRRGACDGSIELRRIEGAQSFAASVDGTVLLVVLDGDLSWTNRPLLERDTVLLPSGVTTELKGHGSVAVVTVSVPEHFYAVRSDAV
jgi:environmental stress-induced protein Ves